MSKSSAYPIGASVTLDDLENDVHSVLHRLRMREPVTWLPVLNAWLVTRRDDAIVTMRDARTYTVDHPGFSTAQVVGPSMLSLDGAEHAHHRKPFEKPFRRREVEARFRRGVSEIVARLVDGLTSDKRAELRRDFAGPIAVQTMISALGLGNISVSAVLGWYDTIVDAVTRVTAGEPVSPEGQAAFASLRENLLPSLQNQPESSLLATASGVADGLSEDQIVSNAAVLLFGGIETTEGMIANSLYFLLTNPHILRRVYADFELIPAVVEESLRMEPAASVIDRYTTRDVQLRDAAIQAGDLVRISLASANRDPDTFPNPDTFDPERPNLQSHVTWAQGPHVCLGLHLARLETHLALEQLLFRLPGLHLMPNPDALDQAKPCGLVFRKPQALQVAWP
ncbi:MAG: cytochrome P450 [Chloroflexota bacterium]